MRVTFQLLDYDSKRMHFFEQLFHAEEGWVSATSENMSLHVDMDAGRTAPFPDAIEKALARMKATHGQLPRPEAAGRRIAMPRKGGARRAGSTRPATHPLRRGEHCVARISTAAHAASMARQCLAPTKRKREALRRGGFQNPPLQARAAASALALGGAECHL